MINENDWKFILRTSCVYKRNKTIKELCRIVYFKPSWQEYMIAKIALLRMNLGESGQPIKTAKEKLLKYMKPRERK